MFRQSSIAPLADTKVAISIIIDTIVADRSAYTTKIADVV